MILLLEVFRKKIIQSCLLVTAVLVSSTVLAAAKKRVDSVDTFVFGRTHVAARQPLFLQTVKSGAFKHKKNNSKNGWDITFGVSNQMNRKVYVVPFAYIKRFLTDPWHWYKAPVLELDVNQSGMVDIGAVPSEDDFKTVFGILRVCSTKEEAEASTYQLTPDEEKIDLDLLSLIDGKGIALHSSKYGVEGERLSYEIVPSHWPVPLAPLDFSVFNSSDQPIYVTSFFYGKEQDADEFTVWRYSKSPVYELLPKQSTMIKVETIKDPYDWHWVRGYLAVFKEGEAKQAVNSTYELLTPHQKMSLGPLASLGNKQVVISSRSYGTETIFDMNTRKVSADSVGKVFEPAPITQQASAIPGVETIAVTS